MWKYYALLSAFFAALTAVLAKKGIAGINSNLATAIRTAVILFITWGIVLFSGAGKQIRSLNAENLLYLLFSGIATGFSWLFYFKALQTGDVARVAPVDKLSIVFVLFFGVVFLHEKISFSLAAGALLILAGSMVILFGR